MNNKSCLDGIKVEDNAFPLNKTYACGKLFLEIVSNCNKCGAPIYGQKLLKEGDIPKIQYSCTCSVNASFRTT